MEPQYIELLIDSRERMVYNMNQELLADVNHKIIQIFPGDYHILVNDRVRVVIERKTLPDYAASLKSAKPGVAPRITNMQYMYNMRKEDPEIILILLIEHTTIPDLTTTFGGIPYINIQSSIMHHILRGVSVFWSRSVQYTLDIITIIMKSIGTFKPEITGSFTPPAKHISREMVITSKPKLNMLETVIASWRQLHGIGNENSIRLAGHIPIRDFLTNKNINTERITGCITNASHKMITALLNCGHPKYYDKMICAIDGVSNAKAICIRLAISADPDINASQLSEVLCNGRKIGKSLAEKVINIIDFVTE